MKVVVTGSLGNISKPLTEKLIENGHAVTVISSKIEKRSDIEVLGATAAIGSLDDVNFLANTFKGADSVYCMIPPNFKELNGVDYYKRIGQNYKESIIESGVKHIVFLSSWGAHLPQGTGTILGSHHVEQILNQLVNVQITHIRPCSIYYNLFNYIAMLKNGGIIGTNIMGTDKIVWVAPKDIATAISEELYDVDTEKQIKIRYVASDEVTADETARILGMAIGRPNLSWTYFTAHQVLKSLIESGFPESFAKDLVDLNESISSGRLGGDYEMNKPLLGRVKLEDFAREFAAAYEKE